MGGFNTFGDMNPPTAPPVILTTEFDALTKQCTACKQVKSSTEFTKDITKADGLRTQCAECRRMADRTRRRAKRESVATVSAVTAAEQARTVKKAEAKSEAHRQAILELIDRHRNEFDALVYSAQVRLGLVDINERPRERWVSLV